MPNYPFPTSEDLIKEVLDNLAARRQLQTQAPTQATESQGKNAMDAATIDGLKQNGANIPQQQPVLDGIARQYAGDITAQKMAYAAAQNDAQRQMASINADMLRQAAQGAGMDLSGYGSDVSLQDAMQNLQTNDARALVEMFQGKYAKPSDQAFTDKYHELVMSGMPVNRAKRLAGRFAQQYQGERVSYLQGMLHGYGFDGRVMTPEGQQIVGQLAAENPQLANMYLNANPNQKDAYNTDNQMAQLAMTNDNAMAKLAMQIAGNMDYLNRSGEIQRDNATHQSNLIEQRDANQQQRSLDFINKNAMAVHSTVKEFLGDDAANMAVASMFNILNRGSGKGGSTNATDDKDFKNYIDALDKTQNRLIEQRNSIVNQYKANLEGMPPEAQEQIAKLDSQLEVIQNAIFGVSGLAPDYPAYTGEEKQDLQTIASIISTQKQYNPKITDEEIFDFVRRWVHEADAGVTDRYIQNLINKLGR